MFISGRLLSGCFRSPPPPTRSADEAIPTPSPPPGTHEGGTAPTPPPRPQEGVGPEQSFEEKPPSIVYSQPIRVTASGANGMNEMTSIDANAVVSSINDALLSSLTSVDRAPYGEMSFFETEFALDEVSLLVKNLKKIGITDQTIEQIPGLYEVCNKYPQLGSKIRTVFELSEQTTESLAIDFGLDKLQARKVKSKVLIAYLKNIDKKMLYNKERKPPNPIIERFKTKYPDKRLRKIIESACFTATAGDSDKHIHTTKKGGTKKRSAKDVSKSNDKTEDMNGSLKSDGAD